MAIYHAHIKNFSRGKGESATAAAAYRAGIDILDTRTRIHHQYSRRRGVISYHMLAPADAPSWCSDPSVFFDACERWESRANSIVGRELEVSLPHELSPEQRQALALSLGQFLVDRYQVVVLAALHAPSAEGDQRNYHVHLLMSARRVGADGLGARAASEFDARGGRGHKEVHLVRAMVSQTINAALEAAGVQQTVDHRSLRTQAIAAHLAGDQARAVALSRRPTRHVGRAITAALRRGTLDPLLSKVGGGQAHVMAQVEAEFARQGRLMAPASDDAPSPPPAERGREQGAADAPQVASQERVREQGRAATASPLALRLGRLARIARTQGKDAQVLNEQAQLIEEWLAAQQEVARSAWESLQSISGLHVEPEAKRALDTAMRKRVDVYGGKQFFYEDSEVLTGAITSYVEAILAPHRMRDQLRRAQAQASEIEFDGTTRSFAKVNSAKRALAKAKASVSASALEAGRKRVSRAREAMVAATEAMERDYYITPLDRVETSPPHVYGGERQSDSNRVQLKPNLRARLQ